MIRKLLRGPAWLSAPALVVGGAALAASGTALGVALGVACWPLAEYAAHRWAMHGLEGSASFRTIHGAHHERPRAAHHFAVPLVVVAPASAVLTLAAGPGFTGGLLLAMAAYDLVHMGCHGVGPLAGRVPNRLVQHHAGHHVTPSRNFSVTVPWLDRALGTDRPAPHPFAEP